MTLYNPHKTEKEIKDVYFFFITIFLPSIHNSKISDFFMFNALLTSKGMHIISVFADVLITFLSNLIININCHVGLNIY